MAICLAVATQKGGAGKSTISINLAYQLAALNNQKTLLIDLDSQGNSSQTFSSSENTTATTSDLFLDKNNNISNMAIQAYVGANKVDNLYVIRSTIKLALVEQQITARVHKEKILFNHLKKINDTFDFIILDCPPSLGVLSINGIYASNRIIIPTLYSRYALDGIADLFCVIREVKESDNFDYTIVRNGFDERNKKTNCFVDSELEKFKSNVAKTIIRRTESINQSQINGEPIFIFDKKSNGSKDFKSLTDEILTTSFSDTKNKVKSMGQTNV
jgi:chromosome partitioning protein